MLWFLCTLGLYNLKLSHLAPIFFPKRGSSCSYIVLPELQSIVWLVNLRLFGLFGWAFLRGSLLWRLGNPYTFLENVHVMGISSIRGFGACIHFILIVVQVVLSVICSGGVWLRCLLKHLLHQLRLVEVLQLRRLDNLFAANILLLEVRSFKVSMANSVAWYRGSDPLNVVCQLSFEIQLSVWLFPRYLHGIAEIVSRAKGCLASVCVDNRLKDYFLLPFSMFATCLVDPPPILISCSHIFAVGPGNWQLASKQLIALPTCRNLFIRRKALTVPKVSLGDRVL